MRSRISVPVAGGAGRHPLDFMGEIHGSGLQRRMQKASNKTSYIVAGVVVGLLVLCIAAWVFISVRKRRAARQNHKYETTNDNESRAQSYEQRRTPSTAERHGSSNRNSAAVDRNTSIRSVMTLPAYRQKALETEQTLGREGERDGIDMVVEMPTAEDEEALRDQEMDAMYQIRRARRQYAQGRDELRSERRDARAQNDAVALREIRERSRAASASHTEEIEDLRASHERIRGSRQRAVSSVSYAELGVARHDGTRLRANSNESERMGLLSDAASMAASQRSPSSLQHRRDRSASSALSINTSYSDCDRGGGSPMGRSRTNSRANTPDLGHTTPRAGSSPEIIDSAEADLGESEMPPHSPPGYEDVSLDEVTPVHSQTSSPYVDPPPEYSTPTEARNNNRLSQHTADIAAEDSGTVREVRRSSRRTSVIPQLPSLRLSGLPKIVVEPSSARPRDDGETQPRLPDI